MDEYVRMKKDGMKMIGLISVDKVGDENFAWTFFCCTIFLSLEHCAKPVRKKCFWLNLICTDSFEPVYWSQSAQNITTIASSKRLDFNLLKLVLIISFQFLTRKNHFKVMFLETFTKVRQRAKITFMKVTQWFTAEYYVQKSEE